MTNHQLTVLVTGGAGYIGSHTVQALQKKGYQTIILDNLVNGHRDLVENVLQSELIIGDVGDRTLLDELFATRSVAAVMHFAGSAYVGESLLEPAKYYRNNVVQTLTLLEAMVAASVNNLIVASTCATYGIPEQVPITEDSPQQPINTYGKSKLMVEKIIQDFERAYGLRFLIFRFFNAAGADPLVRLGEDHTPEPHLIPSVLLTALGQRESISIFGTDYPTPDGTCVRDYIHVVDLTQAYVKGLEYLFSQGNSNIFNLGNSSGFSVRQVIETAIQVTGKKINAKECPRRPGDPPRLVASSEKAKRILGWQPQYPDLKTILSHAWNWHQQRHGKENPLVSVIIPAYNAEKFIERTLQSVLTQTYDNIEVIVVDDGSQDRTVEIVQSAAQQDSRVTLLRQLNSGVAAARNLAIEKSKGEFIAPIDADDIWYPQNLEKQVEVMGKADASVGLVYSWSIEIDEEDSLDGGFHNAHVEGNVYSALIYRNFIGNASATLIRRICFETVGNYNCDLKKQNAQGCEDWDLYLRIANVYQFRVVPEFLVGYRQLTSSMSSNYTSMSKSHQLLMAEVKKQALDVEEVVYQLSDSNFSIYLAIKSSCSGNHKNTLIWLYKAWQSNPRLTLLFHHSYILLVKSFFKLIAQPITSKIWSDHQSWVQFRKQLKFNHRKLTISDIHRRVKLHSVLPSTLFEKKLLEKLRTVK